ncbi:hypothetical protein Runsl_4709 [Runella slithyformis DSM 19594]|uniref:Uncharacterized protein n=1 Tax=Runella slithyformis (strain ATCC 29530 / DSM 19594 / LMG 11500 / NCIMB 11436 / LSU 4) TaxID=761193 RepID=A0A7U4E863_RUNSL|nr:hypothetical protein Runsl_4709 [Runella slithyformis DSM 19594]
MFSTPNFPQPRTVAGIEAVGCVLITNTYDIYFPADSRRFYLMSHTSADLRRLFNALGGVISANFFMSNGSSINQCFAFIPRPLSLVLCLSSPVPCPSSSVYRPLSLVPCPSSSVYRPLSLVFCLSSPVLCLSSPVPRPLSSVYRPLSLNIILIRLFPEKIKFSAIFVNNCFGNDSRARSSLFVMISQFCSPFFRIPLFLY